MSKQDLDNLINKITTSVYYHTNEIDLNEEKFKNEIRGYIEDFMDEQQRKDNNWSY